MAHPRASAPRPVLILNMGKVASQSVWFSLRDQTEREVIHLHFLFDNPRKPQDQEIYRRFVRDREPVDIITLTREPVGRNVSQFFQDFEKYTDRPASEVPAGEAGDLVGRFVERFPHDQPATWFDENIRAPLGIDVCASPFPACGFSILSQGPADLLVLRSELDDRVKSAAIGAFLHLETFRLARHNEAGGKAYSDLYRQFRDAARLPPALLDRVLESRYARHFYSPEERAAARQRWSG